MNSVKILFVCSGNTCRSPMASALFRKRLEREFPEYLDVIEVDSAGIYTLEGLPASEEAIEVMARKEDLDLSEHRSKRIHTEMVEEADLILAMTALHKDELVARYPWAADKIFTLKEFAAGEDRQEGDIDADVMDPFGLGLLAYEEAYAELKEVIADIVKRLVDLLSKPNSGGT